MYARRSVMASTTGTWKGMRLLGGVAVLVAMVLAWVLMSGTALGHDHSLSNPGDADVCLPQEPAHIHDEDPTNGAIRNNKHHSDEGTAHLGALHPIHHFLHWGPGAAAQDSAVTGLDEDPVNVTGGC
jgi:hypothetical protein